MEAPARRSRPCRRGASRRRARPTRPPRRRQAPARCGTNGGRRVKDKLLTQSDNRLHINDLSQMSMPDLRGLASKMGVNHEALVSMKKQEIIFQILKGAHGARRA